MMKSLHFKTLTIACSLLTGLLLGACDDDLTGVGTTIQPPEDLITVYTDTFQLKASTVKLDSVFAKTSDCLLGEMYDPVYGNIKADFLCQFYCEEGFQFAKTPYKGKIDSVALVIFYPNQSWYGDSLAPMQVSVYPIDRPLKRNFYTNDDPTIYCDMSKPYGVAMYSPHDMTVTDSIRYLEDSNGNLTYVPSVRVNLPLELGQQFYDETINNPGSFANQESFNAFFPGVYVTNTYGSGNLIKTYGDYIELHVYYNHSELDTQGEDSLIYRYEVFATSKEVVQINRFENSHFDHLLEDQGTHTYVKSPAGVCTKLVVPTTQISNTLDVNDRFINGFSLELKYLPEDERDFIAYYPPNYLLLLPEDSVTSFFEKGNVENNRTSFLSYMYDYSNSLTSTSASYYGYNSSTRTYTFGNISTVLKEHINNSPDEDLRLLVVPVTRDYGTYSSGYYSSYYYTKGLSHSFFLSGAKIRTEDEYMKVVVVSSKFENKE